MIQVNIRGSVPVLAICLTVLAATVYAQIQDSQDKRTAPDATMRPASTTPPDGDMAFVSEVIEFNFAQIELGRLASTRAQSPRVKSYAEMMVKEHTSALPKWQAMAGRGAAKPQLNAEHEKLKARLSSLTGPEFDREYIAAMAAGHREALTMFEHQAAVMSASAPAGKPDSVLNKHIRDTMPGLKKHLAQAELIQKGLTQPVKKTSTK